MTLRSWPRFPPTKDLTHIFHVDPKKHAHVGGCTVYFINFCVLNFSAHFEPQPITSGQMKWVSPKV